MRTIAIRRLLSVAMMPFLLLLARSAGALPGEPQPAIFGGGGGSSQRIASARDEVCWSEPADLSAIKASSEIIQAYGLESEMANDFLIGYDAVVTKAIGYGGYYNWMQGDPEVTSYNWKFYNDGGCLPVDLVATYSAPGMVTFIGFDGFGYPTYRIESPQIAVGVAANQIYWFGLQAADHPFPPQWGRQGTGDSRINCETMFKSALFGYPDWTPASDALGSLYEASQEFECIPDSAGVIGACCFEDGRCVQMLPVACNAAGDLCGNPVTRGIFMGGPCEPDPCACRGAINQLDLKTKFAFFLGLFGFESYVNVKASNTGVGRWGHGAEVRAKLWRWNGRAAVPLNAKSIAFPCKSVADGIGDAKASDNWSHNGDPIFALGKLIGCPGEGDTLDYHSSNEEAMETLKPKELATVLTKGLEALTNLAALKKLFNRDRDTFEMAGLREEEVVLSFVMEWPDSGYVNNLGVFERPDSTVAHFRFAPREWFSFADGDSLLRLTEDGSDSVRIRMTVPADAAPETLLYRIHGDVQGDSARSLDTYAALIVVDTPGVVAGPVLNHTNGHAYYLLANSPRDLAEIKAAQLGGHLVTVDDQAENDWIFATFGDPGRVLWIGLTDEASEGEFEWSCSETDSCCGGSAYRNWGAPPDDACPSEGGEDYVWMWQAGHELAGSWNDAPLDGFCESMFQACAVVEVCASPCPAAGFTAVTHQQKISDTEGGLGDLQDHDAFGRAIAYLGDLDGDGAGDVAVGASGAIRGAVHVVFLHANGTVKASTRIDPADLPGNCAPPSSDFGTGVASLGDLDGDGPSAHAVAVGVPWDDDGGHDRGAVQILFLDAGGHVLSCRKISSIAGGLAGPLRDDDWFGWSVGGLGDLNGDGIADLAVGATLDDDGGAAENRGAVWILFLNRDGTVRDEQKISATAGGFDGALVPGSGFGNAVTRLADYDGDGNCELAVAAHVDDDGGCCDRGAVWVLFLDAAGTVHAHQKISATEGGLGSGALDPGDYFGSGLSSPGDMNADAIDDLVVGAYGDDDGGQESGAVWLLVMNADGTVRCSHKIDENEGGFDGPLDPFDYFGTSIAGLADLDGDSRKDLAVGAFHDDDGGENRGAVWILFSRDLATSVQDAHGASPREELLARPNPFTRSVAFETPGAGGGRIEVFDTAGRRVRSLLVSAVNGARGGGAIWDGKDESLANAPAGIYFARWIGVGRPRSATVILAR